MLPSGSVGNPRCAYIVVRIYGEVKKRQNKQTKTCCIYRNNVKLIIMAKSELKKRLQKMLDGLSLSSEVTASDIEDIVWNESNSTDFSRLAGMLIENQKDIGQVNQIMAIVQEAWNTFPHKALDGKSPEQLVEEHRGLGTGNNRHAAPINSTKKRKTMSEVFAEEYPQNVQIIKIGKSEWGFEFPQLYHELTEQYWQLKESDITARESERGLKDLLISVPELFDAANDLAIFYGYNGDMKSAKNIYEASTSLAKSYIPPEFIPGKHRIIWAYLDNRPFLRLLASYAQFIAETEKQSRAIPLYEEILSFNPNDNQAIRFLLATTYLRTGQPEKVIELAAHYPDETTPDLEIGRAHV